MNQHEAWQQRLKQLNQELPDLLRNGQGKSVLYVGATPHRFQMGRELFEAGYKITLLEAFKQHYDYYEDHPWLEQRIYGDVRYIKNLANGQKWDVVVWWHGPEHVNKDELPEVLKDLESVADLVILGCPWGQNIHGMIGGNPYSVHECHHDTTDFEQLGYEARTLGQKNNPNTWCHILSWKATNQKQQQNCIVYTANFGSRDELLPPVDSMARHICFADNGISVPGWEIHEVERQFNDPRREARMYKILSHKWFPDADVTVWQDANCRLLVPPSTLVNMLKQNDMTLMAHPERTCIYDEAEAVKELEKAPAPRVDEQMKAYHASNFPENVGLVATSVLVRRHTATIQLFNAAWWAELSRFTVRDQLSFNYVAWLLGTEYSTIPGYLWQNEWFEIHKHKG